MLKLIATLALTSAVSVSAQMRGDDMRIYVAIAEYYGAVYVAPPSGGADYVHLRGEPLSRRVSIVNHGAAGELRLRGGADRSFDVGVERLRESANQPGVSLKMSPPEKVSGGHRTNVTWPTPLKRSDSIEWRAVVAGLDDVEAGLYRFHFRSRLQTGTGQPLITNNDSVIVELRDVTGPAESAEVLRIRSTRAFANRDFDACLAAAERLQAVHPRSVFAALLKADVAAIRGRNQAAKSGYGRALEMLRSGQDTLLLQGTGILMTEELIATVQGKLNRIQ